MRASARKQLDFVRDEVVVALRRADRPQRWCSAAGPQPFEYHFYVVEDDELNAFAAPAGYVYVNTGTILARANVSELAGVIAHEIGHVALRHIAKNYNKQRGRGDPLPARRARRGDLRARRRRRRGAARRTARRDARRAEHASGARPRRGRRLRRRVLPRAGYDPNGLVTFFETLEPGVRGRRAPAELPVEPSRRPSRASRPPRS